MKRDLIVVALLLAALALSISAQELPGAGESLHKGPIEILSDTRGVDFSPYLKQAVRVIQNNWYAIMPDVAQRPQLASGTVKIEFVVLPDGKITGMRMVHPSGDVRLDRGGWGAIKASSPLAPLPKKFDGPYLTLRLTFIYNPPKGTAGR